MWSLQRVCFILSLLAFLAIPALGGNAEVYVKVKNAQTYRGTDGTPLATHPGDYFPFLKYNDEGTMIKVQAGEATVWMPKADADFVAPDDAATAAAQYRAEQATAPGHEGSDEGVAQEEKPAQARGDHPGGTEGALLEQMRLMVRQELAAALGDVPSTKTDSFPVDATSEAWQNSGVYVKAGQHVEVQAAEHDKWNIGWGPVTADGYTFEQDASKGPPVYHPGKMFQDWHWGSLICAVGARSELDDERRQVEIGMKRGFTVDNDGYVYLKCNDAPGYYDDNSGIIHVRIRITNGPMHKGTGDAPEPDKAPGR